MHQRVSHAPEGGVDADVCRLCYFLETHVAVEPHFENFALAFGQSIYELAHIGMNLLRDHHVFYGAVSDVTAVQTLIVIAVYRHQIFRLFLSKEIDH